MGVQKLIKSCLKRNAYIWYIFSICSFIPLLFLLYSGQSNLHYLHTYLILLDFSLFGKAQGTLDNQRKIIHKQHHNYHDNSHEYEKTILVVAINVCILSRVLCVWKDLSYRGLWIEDRCCNNVWEIFRWFIHFSFKKIDTHWKERHVFKTSDSYTYYSVTYLNKFW